LTAGDARDAHKWRNSAKTGRRATWVGGTGRLPNRPLNDTYPVPEAPQSHVRSSTALRRTIAPEAEVGQLCQRFPRPRGMRVRGAPDRPHCPVAVARRPRSARARNAPCPAAAPDVPPLALAHVPAASAQSSARLAPRTPWTTRRHSNWCRASRAGGSARYMDGTRRLPISPLIDTYLVPEAPQGCVSPDTAPPPGRHHRPTNTVRGRHTATTY
jgi:hypothetical protein